MNLIDGYPYDFADLINPKGQVAKTYERCGKMAVWLETLCIHWVAFHDGDADAARQDPPYELPKSFPEAERVNKAIKEVGLYELGRKSSGITYPWDRLPKLRISRLKDGSLSVKRGNLDARSIESIPGAPRRPVVETWAELFDYWQSGALRRNLEEMLAFMPGVNAEAVQQEML